MENRKYIVCRDNIYVGEVVKTRCVFRRGYNNMGINTDGEKLTIQSWKSYRSMLFAPDEDSLANDLLYNSPNYPILNMSDEEACLYFNRSIILIKEAYNIAELLKYFGYGEELTYDDIQKIRKTFFSSKFAMDNCELFGMKEVYPGEWKYYKDDVEISDPKKLKKYIAEERKERLMGCRSFVSINEGLLPTEYWHILNQFRDNTFIDVVQGACNRMDSFAPHSHEGKIKRLTR